MSKTLYIQAIMNNGSTKSYSIPEAKTTVTMDQVSTAFQVAIDKDAFKIGGVKPLSIKTAFLQEIVRTDLELS